MALSAIIFDVDGTLIDSNAAHVQAWDQALKQHHYQVSADRIAVEIGKGGDKLIPSNGIKIVHKFAPWLHL
jgi:beta-phosphoglucomutase-like phosphatase (HAD superfamily)